VIHLEDDVAVARGDVLVPVDAKQPALVEAFTADVAWVHTQAAKPGERYLVKHGTREVRAIIEGVEALLDVESGRAIPGAAPLVLNTLARVRVRLFEPLAVDAYADLRESGSFLLIDPASGATRAAGMVRAW